MNGCTFPGRTSSSAGAVALGATTDTAVSAACFVCAFRVLRALTRDQIPDPRRAATKIPAIAKPSQCLDEACFGESGLDELSRTSTLIIGGGGGSECPLLCFLSSD